ncbi:hypothetical protein D3C86_2113430 [compost metagenome]
MGARRHLEETPVIEALAIQAVGHQQFAWGHGVQVDPGLFAIDRWQGAGASPQGTEGNQHHWLAHGKLPLANY